MNEKNHNSQLSTKFDSIIAQHLHAYENAIQHLEQSESKLKKARHYAEKVDSKYFYPEHKCEYNEARIKLVRDTWMSLIKSTQLIGLMDTDTRKKMYDDLSSDNVPALTKENIFNILIDLYERKDEILANSLLNVFYKLSPVYKSNDQIKLSDKRIIFFIGSGWGHSKEGYLTDLDRVFHYMDGVPFNSENYNQTLGYLASQERPGEMFTPYFKLRMFQNGNVHLYFRRKDLVKQCNKLIAYHNKNKLGCAA